MAKAGGEFLGVGGDPNFDVAHFAQPKRIFTYGTPLTARGEASDTATSALTQRGQQPPKESGKVLIARTAATLSSGNQLLTGREAGTGVTDVVRIAGDGRADNKDDTLSPRLRAKEVLADILSTASETKRSEPPTHISVRDHAEQMRARAEADIVYYCINDFDHETDLTNAALKALRRLDAIDTTIGIRKHDENRNPTEDNDGWNSDEYRAAGSRFSELASAYLDAAHAEIRDGDEPSVHLARRKWAASAILEDIDEVILDQTVEETVAGMPEDLPSATRQGVLDAVVYEDRRRINVDKLSDREREVYESLKDQFSDEAIATLFEFAVRVRDGLQNPPEEGTPELEIEEHPHPEEVSQHLFTVAGPIDIHDPRHGMVHGTSLEVVKAIIKYGVIPGFTSSVAEPRRERRDVSVYPTPHMYEAYSEILDPLFPYDVAQMVELSGEANNEASSYADVLSADHALLSMLGIQLSEKMRFAEETSVLLHGEDGFVELQALGVPLEEILRLRETATSRKGFLITFGPQVVNEPEVTIEEGDLGHGDITIRPGDRHLRYGLITGIEPLGPEEAAYLESLRAGNNESHS